MRQTGHIQNHNKRPDLKGSQHVHGVTCLVLARRSLHVCGVAAYVVVASKGGKL